MKTAPAPANPSTEQAQAPIPPEPVINSPHLNRTLTLRRKAANRTDPLYLAPPPQNIAAPLSLSLQAEEISATKKPRVEESLPTTTDEAARMTSPFQVSFCKPMYSSLSQRASPFRY
jgi:hypothetical protein